MPGTSKAKSPSGIEIIFEELTHKYTSEVNGKLIDYTSGTTFIHKFIPEFDPTGAIAARCAKKQGVSVEELKKQWAEKGRIATTLGTRCHEICEDIELGREVRNKAQDEKEEKLFANAAKMAAAFRQKLDILGVEKIVFSPELQIAGTIDLFAKSRKDGSYLIIDHKTNKSIDTDNKYKNFCLAPIEHVPNLNFWHYGLQLNLYAYLLKYGKWIPKDAKFRFFLNHISEEQAKLIELPDMQSEIKDMMIDFLLKKLDVCHLPLQASAKVMQTADILDSI